MARGDPPEQAAKTTFRDVFAVAEFRALWAAQLLSVIGDQLARVAVIKRRLDSLNTPLMRELDSLQRAKRDKVDVPHSRGDLPEVTDPLIDNTIETLRSNMHGAEADAYEVLNGTQLQQALQMVKEARTNAALTVGRDKSPN